MKTLYKRQKYGFPIVTVVLLLTCSVITIPTYFNKELWYVFANQSKPFYFWQIFSGNFEHSIFPINSMWMLFDGNYSWFLWIHFFGNMSILLIFGMIVERILGPYKFLLLSIFGLCSHVIFFQIKYYGEIHFGSGASGIVYTYIPVALYIIIKHINQGKINLKGDKLFYLVIFNLILSWIVVTIFSTWEETNAAHLLATIVGIVFLLLFCKQIDKEIYELHKKNILNTLILQKRSRYLLAIVPLCALLVEVSYFCGFLDDMFIRPAYISAHDTINEVVRNDNKIEISFAEAITKFNSSYTSGSDLSKITYSEDNKTVYIVFPNGLHKPHKIKLSYSKGLNGKIVQDIEINIKK